MDLTRRHALFSFLGLGIAKPLLIPAKTEPVTLSLPPKPVVIDLGADRYGTPHVAYKSASMCYHGRAELGLDGTAPAKSTIRCPLTISTGEIVSMALWSDQPVTIRTNSSMPWTGWGETLHLSPREPQVWAYDYKRPCPFRHDIIRLYITNHSNQPASIKLRAILA